MSPDRRLVRPARDQRLRCSYHDGNLAVSLARAEPLLDPGAPGPTRSRRRARFYDRLDLICTMSDWLRRSFVDDFGQAPEKVITVGAGANLASLPQAPERSFESPRILFVGKQWERKGGPQLLEAFRLVRAERPDAELWVVGPEQSPAEEPGVRFLGRVYRGSVDGERRLDELYRGATVFAMPSVYEPFGVVFLEAMAYRLRVSGATAARCPRSSTTAPRGYVVPARDVERLAQRLLDLADPDRARAFGEAGHRRFLERYTWDAVAARMLDAVAERSSAEARADHGVTAKRSSPTESSRQTSSAPSRPARRARLRRASRPRQVRVPKASSTPRHRSRGQSVRRSGARRAATADRSPARRSRVGRDVNREREVGADRARRRFRSAGSTRCPRRG